MPGANEEPLRTSLESYHINVLQEIANTLGLRPDRHPARKAWLVSELSKLIPKLAHSPDFIKRLSSSERAALGLVVALDGVVTLRDVTLPLVVSGVVRIEGQPATADRPAVGTLLEDLVRKGLIINLTNPVKTSTVRNFTPLNRIGIAPEVLRVLPLDLLPPPKTKPEVAELETSAPPYVREGDLRQFMRQLFFVWAELRRQPARQLKAGGMGKRDQRRLAQALGLGDEDTGLERVTDLYAMLERLNLVSGDGTTITAVESNAAILFWNATPVRQLDDITRAYARLATPLVDEYQLSYRPYGYLQGYGTRSVQELREDMIGFIGQIATLDWISFPFFMSLLTGGRAGSFMLGEDTMEFVLNSLHWYGPGYRRDMETNLERLERLTSQAALEELQRIGIVDLGYKEAVSTNGSDSTADEPLPEATTVRVTPVVRDYYEDHPNGEALPEPAWQVILQPDFQVLAMGPVPLRVLSNLELISIHEKLGQSVITFRITREAVYQALQRGETVETMLTYLEEATETPVPQNIRRSLEEWREQHERIVLRRKVSLFQVNSTESLDRMLADSVLQRYLHRLGDREAWLHPKDAGRVEERLMELEMLVAHSRGAQEDLPDSLRWREDTLEPRAELPSLYVSGTLRRIAEPHDGRWHLTAESLQMATTLGLDPLDVIALLEEMTGAALPEVWEKRLQAWGKHYGTGQTAQVRLLRMMRPDALEELRRADPRLHRLLRPLPGTENLAVIADANWDEVSDLLASWGVEVETARWW